MNYLKKAVAWIFALISIFIFPYGMIGLLLLECVLCKVTGRLYYRLDRQAYRILERWSPDTLRIIDKKEPDLESTLEEVATAQSFVRSIRQKYWDWFKILCQLMYKELNEGWRMYENNKLLIIMDTNASNPFYKELFKFLTKYFGVYRILPGIFAINEGIMQIKIQVAERNRDGLTIDELETILEIHLINALNGTDELHNIPSCYWSENTVYFSNLERNLEHGYLIAMLAVSKAGSDRIIEFREKKERIGFTKDLNETL